MTMRVESTTTCVDYLVLTKCGRRFCWAAPNLDRLFRDMIERNFIVTFVQPMSEYEAEILAKEAQEDFVHAMRMELERELKESA